MAAVQYKPGDRAPMSGVYRAHHAGAHIGRENITVLQGEAFRQCSGCGPDVSFQLLHAGQRFEVLPHFEPSARPLASKRRIAK